MMKPTRFAVPIFDQWLVHLPIQRVSALVSEEGLRQIVSGPVFDDPASDEDEHVLLRQLHEDLRSEPASIPPPRTGPFDPSMMAIVTTRGCNINCVYCDFGGPTSKKVFMDPAIAVRAIDWMADVLVERGRSLFFLHLFGGEPLIAGDLVDIIVHRCRAVCAARELRPYIDVSTNGVISVDRARWVGDHLDSVVLSFDGPPDFQNRNRPGNHGRPTFDIVDRTARILSDSPIELCLRVCVTSESVRAMPDITRWMFERYHPSIINFEPLTENDLTATARLGAANPYEYAIHWIKSKRIADELGVRLVYSATETAAPRLTSCPVGEDAVVVTPDGIINGCYLQPGDWLKHGMDMHLGSVSATAGVTINHGAANHLRHLILDKPRCQRCVCQWSCAGGCHVSNTYRNCPEGYVDFCLQTRLITTCLLLEDLGEHRLVDELMAHPSAMHRLAEHLSDTLENPVPSHASPANH